MAIERINLLSVPVDIVHTEDIEMEILAMLEKPGVKQVIFISIWDLLYARMNPEFLICLKNASLVLPVSKSIIFGASFLHFSKPVLYNPFSAIISMMTVLDNHHKSLYLLGSHKKSLMQAERNVHATFSGLQIVGRYVGYYSKDEEKNIIQAIFKASPSMVLMSSGIQGAARWVYRRRNCFKSSIFVWNKDVLDIFSKRKKRVSPNFFNRMLEIARNPLKLFLVFPYIWYLLLLVWSKMFKK